jgi:hypothetical protein
MIFDINEYTRFIVNDHIGHGHVYLKGWKNSKIKLKYKLERVSRYFDRIKVMNTSAKIFKII